MKKLGTYLLIFGVGSFVLPLFGLQFKLFSAMGESQGMVGAGAVVLGGLLMVMGGRSEAAAQ
jgi:hypothetical protein